MRKRPRGYRLLLVIGTILALVSSQVIHNTSSTAVASDNQSISKQLDQISSYVTTSPTATKPYIAAKAFLLTDEATNTTLTAQNADQQVPIASTTKMMTALVVRQYLELNDVATIYPDAEQIPETLVHLVPGEKITVGNLLKAMLIPSGNDAAYSLAYYYNDKVNSATKADYQPFVDKMNLFATAHNLTKTHYGDAAGLDDDNGHSTAHDLANIARLVLADPVLAQIVSTPSATVTSVDGGYTHALTNSNRLIQSADPLYMPNVIGIKTGFTLGAGHCLVSAYQLNGRTLIGVVLNTNVYSATASAAEMQKLFVWANTNVQINKY